MSRIVAALLPVVVAASAVAATFVDTVIEAPEVGLRLTIPDVGWDHREVRGGDGLSAIAAGPPGEGGLIQLIVQVSPASDNGPDAAKAHARTLRAAVAGDATIAKVEDLELDVAGHVAHGFRAVQTALGQTFRINLVFLHVRGLQYRIQFHAPRDRFDEQWKIAREVLDGLELIELDAGAQEEARLRELAARCGSQVDWATGWDDAAGRARAEGRLIVVAVNALPGFSVGNQLDQGVFTSPEVLGLMEHRFVGWRWRAGDAAPFVAHDVFGLSGSTFGAGLLVCSPTGVVLRQAYLIAPSLVADVLRDALRAHPDLAPAPEPTAEGAAERLAFLIDSGQLDAARMALGARADDEPRAVSYQRARLHLAERDGGAALELLHATGAKDGDEPALARLLVDEAGCHLGLGGNDRASAAIERALRSDPDDTSRAEALLMQGALAWAARDVDGARELWSFAASELPEEPAAWIAAAGLVGPALDLDLEPDLRWPTEAAERMAFVPEPHRAAPGLKIEPAITAATDWLVRTQRADGGWDVPYGSSDRHPAPHALTMASQAICTLALVRAGRHVAPERGAQMTTAVERGLARYLADRQTLRDHPRPVAFMDYTCWASSYGLFFLTEFLDGPGARLPSIESEAAHLVDDLVRIQAPNGGWSYYLSGTVDGASQGAAMSFTTATVLLALEAARETGLDVPADTLQRGDACLASLRGTNGVFAYMRLGPGPFEAGEVGPSGAAARGPVCTLALQRAGRLDASAMTAAFDVYVTHLGVFGAEARKALMHAGPSGQGSHYLLYDYSTAAEALRATGEGDLDAGLRDVVRATILRELADCRNADGSFVDNPLLGCAPGTGLAVMALLDLR